MDKFISDPHLSHENIIKFERTQFQTIKEHDEFIKNLITTNLHPNDTFYVLGDVGEMSQENIQFWKNLKCKTILIRGNHDTQKQKLLQAFDVVSEIVFVEEVLDAEIEALIQKRQEARAKRDFRTADQIRDQLAAQGIKLLDTKDGVRWQYI